MTRALCAFALGIPLALVLGYWVASLYAPPCPCETNLRKLSLRVEKTERINHAQTDAIVGIIEE